MNLNIWMRGFEEFMQLWMFKRYPQNLLSYKVQLQPAAPTWQNTEYSASTGSKFLNLTQCGNSDIFMNPLNTLKISGKWELFPRWFTTSEVDQNCGHLTTTVHKLNENYLKKKKLAMQIGLSPIFLKIKFFLKVF